MPWQVPLLVPGQVPAFIIGQALQVEAHLAATGAWGAPWEAAAAIIGQPLQPAAPPAPPHATAPAPATHAEPSGGTVAAASPGFLVWNLLKGVTPWT